MTPNPSAQSALQTLLLTAATMVAFAANSVLCRLALAPGLIDAASFAAVRVAAGAVTLCLIVLVRTRKLGLDPRRTDWRTVAMLFIYMVMFSFAYLSLSAGTGALILFGAVQITMFVWAQRAGEHFPPLAWAGLGLAVLGLVYLVSPGVTAPEPLGAVLMAVAGIAWGLYSLWGKAAADPLDATMRNFVYTLPPAVAVAGIFVSGLHASAEGIILAVASGAVASGCGYVLWYAALRGLTATRAATVQLSVPVIAAFGGILLLEEPVTLRLVLASAATLGGIALVLGQRAAKAVPVGEAGDD